MATKGREKTARTRLRLNAEVFIGITPDCCETEDPLLQRYEVSRACCDAVLMAGATPLVLPYIPDRKQVESYLDLVDGLIVTGGAFDISPKEYGQQRIPQCGPDRPERTRFERTLLAGALRRDLPTLGICGGMQLMNVVLGGSLFQDILTELPEAKPHEQRRDTCKPFHGVSVRRGTRLSKAVGEGQLMVNSSHHQAVRHLGEGLTITALAPDGVIEALEAGAHKFFVGVQWHPERLLSSVPANFGLFRDFVKVSTRGKA